VTVTEASPRRDQSLQGHTAWSGRGLPTALPAGHCLVLGRDHRFGLRRYERVFTRDRSRAGQAKLTRQGISLRCSPHRYGAWTISLSQSSNWDSWRMASEDFTEKFAQRSTSDGSLSPQWPFLLIVRTGRFVTCHSAPNDGAKQQVPPDTRGFQHIASCTIRDHSRKGQIPGTIPGLSTLGTLLLATRWRQSLRRISRGWPGHFCLAPYVAI